MFTLNYKYYKKQIKLLKKNIKKERKYFKQLDKIPIKVINKYKFYHTRYYIDERYIDFNPRLEVPSHLKSAR